MINYSELFNTFCEIVDEPCGIYGIKVTRNLSQFNTDFPEVEGHFPNWVFYNYVDDEIPYILVSYAPCTSNDGDVEFMVIGAQRDSLIDWETGIQMVIGE